jgi:hypothetical protein
VRLNKAYNKVRIGQFSSAKFRIQNRLEQEDALWSLLFNFASESAIRAVSSNETYQLMIFANSFNLLGSCANNNYKEKPGAFVITSKEVGLEVNAQKIMCMPMPRK